MRFLNLNYVKRYRMEFNLRRWQAAPVHMPAGYRLIPWDCSLIDEHARVKYLSFREGLDAQVFPCLGEFEGCQRLMSEIKAREGFIPEATWLSKYLGSPTEWAEYCGTIQAVRTQKGQASIQNIAVLPQHQGQGVGAGMILASLLGLQQVGITQVNLEVTAQNHRAVQLYRRLGFRTVRTVYKTIELACGMASR